jgi:aryl-alcohol dehydrogenase-like predicted oxidoreductase
MAYVVLADGGTVMEMRVFGRSGMQLSVLGFGCGAVGGLMVRGDLLDQERAIARAIAAGVNYFDTAVQYGNGESEKNLGRILQSLKPANAVVGTKVRLPSAKFNTIADAVVTSLEGSLTRLHRDRVDIFHLHNAVTETGGGEALSVQQVLGEVVPAFERLRQQGKARFLGFTAVGDTTALHQVIDAHAFDSAQVVYNMLNPSAAADLPSNYPAQDYGRLFDHTVAAGVGVVGIRVLAGGALSGSTERHPVASPPPEPIGSAISYGADVARAPSVAAGRGRLCHEPDRSRHAVCVIPSRDRHYLSWSGNAPTVRGCARRGSKRSLAGRRARPADDVAASVRWRTTVIYRDCRPGKVGTKAPSDVCHWGKSGHCFNVSACPLL